MFKKKKKRTCGTSHAKQEIKCQWSTETTSYTHIEKWLLHFVEGISFEKLKKSCNDLEYKRNGLFMTIINAAMSTL